MFNIKALFLIALAGITAANPSLRGRDDYVGKHGKPRNFIMACCSAPSPPAPLTLTAAARSRSRQQALTGRRQVIPDGFGVASETMARDFVHWGNNGTTVQPIDKMVMGLVRTRATDSYVTDSAASATAYSCGIKSYNGAIGVGDDFMPCGTVLEAAHLQGHPPRPLALSPPHRLAPIAPITTSTITASTVTTTTTITTTTTTTPAAAAAAMPG